MRIKTYHFGLFVLTLLLGLFLELLKPSHGWLVWIWPQWFTLIMAYWILEQPQRVSMMLAVFIGLVIDIAQGIILGEHALILVITVFFLQQTRLKFRFFPLWQQAVSLAVVLGLQQVLHLGLYKLLNLPQQWLMQWSTVGISILLWPWVFLLLDRLNHQLKTRNSL